MNPIDRAKAALTARNSQKNYSGLTTGFGSFGYNRGFSSTYQNPLLKIIGNPCDSLDPRVKLPSYQALTHALPIIQKAIRVHDQFIGNPVFVVGEKGNPKAVAVLEKFWQDCKIHGQYLNDIGANTGLQMFKSSMVRATLENGSQFFELLQDDAAGARINKNPITGLRLFDPDLFTYLQDPANLQRAILRYQPPIGGYIDVTPDMNIRELHFTDNPKFPWGLPISYGAEMVAERWLRFVIAYVEGAIFAGNPIGLTTVGYDPGKQSALQNAGAAAMEKKDIDDSVRAIAATHTAAIQELDRTGRKQHEVIVLPSTAIDMKTMFYGQGLTPTPAFSQSADTLLEEIARSLNTPFTFLGVHQAGGGIGSDKFTIEKQELKHATESERRILEMNAIRRVNSAVLIANGIIDAPDAYQIEWETPDLDDEKLEAEAELVEAQAVAQQLLNAATMMTEFSGAGNVADAVNEYLKECDLGYLEF